MKNTLVPMLLFVVCGPVSAVTLNFDDVTSDVVATIQDGYQGLNFSNFGVVDPVAVNLGHTGYGNGLKSGKFVGFNPLSEPASIMSTTKPIKGFRGFFTAAFVEGNLLTVTGSATGFTQTRQVFLYTSSPVLYGFDFGQPVTQITFSTTVGGNHHFAVDDLTIALVPEPGTMAALGAGALVLARRRRRK